MRKIFHDIAIDARYKELGYVVLPFCSETGIDELKKKMQSFKPSDDFKGNQETEIGKQPFHITFFDSDFEYKKAVLEFTRAYFSDKVARLIFNYKCVQANVFLKPAKTGFVYPHQNLTIVSEKNFNTFSLWLPMQNTNFDNGTICLIPRTQKGFVKYRNTHLYWPYVDVCRTEIGKDFFIPVEVKKGEILILDDRIIHYTPVNKTNEDRWVLHSLWAPKEAQLKYFDKNDKDIMSYNVSDDFWQFNLPGRRITDRPPDEIFPNDEVIYTDSEFSRLIGRLKSIS